MQISSTDIFYNNFIVLFKVWKNILSNSSLTKYGFSNFENKVYQKARINWVMKQYDVVLCFVLLGYSLSIQDKWVK